MDLLDTHVYGLIGEEGFTRLVAGFYRRVPTDDILAPMYPKQDFAGQRSGCAGFSSNALAGPMPTHSGAASAAAHAARAVQDRCAWPGRWVELMEASLAEAQLPAEAIPPLRKFFHEAATFMINHVG
jgi:hemoglobin